MNKKQVSKKALFSLISPMLILVITGKSSWAQDSAIVNSGKSLYAQDSTLHRITPPQYIQPFFLFLEGDFLSDSGKYDEAASIYEQISRSDSAYPMAVYQDAICRVSAGEDSLAIPLCRKGIQLHTEYNPDFYNFMASAYIDMNRSDDAIKMLKDTAIPAYPNIYLLRFSLGLAYYKLHQYDSAIACFEKAIDLNIFDASSHYYLGKCCLEQGRMIPALLSLQFYLLLEPAASRSFTTVQLIEQVSKGNYDYNKATAVDPSKYNDGVFDELDMDIKSQIALSENYPSKTIVQYDVMKQCQLFMEKLTYTPNSNNLWMEMYAPFFTEIEKKGFYEPYIYYIMSSVQGEKLQKEIEKNKKKISEFINWAGKTLAEKRGKKEVTVNGVKKTLSYLYYSNHLVKAIGEENSKGNAIGEWTIYNEHSGTEAAKGNFNEKGNKDGEWNWYYYDGTLREKTQFKDDKREGNSQTWYINGAQKGKYTFHNDKLNGEVWEYNSSGVLTSHGNYVNDNPTGQYIINFDDGKQKYVTNYVNGNLDGVQKQFYLNGQLADSSISKKGENNGLKTDFWPNGKLEDCGEYKKGNITGHWKFYFKDGTLQKEGVYNKKGNTIGLWTSYYRNGKKDDEINYNKAGELDGLYTVYDEDGIKYTEYEYTKNKVKRITYYDKSGKIIYETKAAGKDTLPVKDFYPDGTLSDEGKCLNSANTGHWKFYSETGSLQEEATYQDGYKNGMDIEYYPGGKVMDSVNYDDDKMNGLYSEYFKNGKLKTTGWYIDGQKQGDWYSFNARDTLISHLYYISDNVTGYADYYDVNGRLTTEDFRNNLGYLDKIWLYDTTGTKIIYTYNSDKGNGAFKPVFNNGQLKLDNTYIAGCLDGPQKWYYFNGNIKAECNELSDNYQGKLTNNYENGIIASVNTYNNGILSGPTIEYYENGSPFLEEYCFDGNAEGPYKEYYDNRHIRLTGSFEDGEEEGEKKYFFEDSSLYCVAMFHNGFIVKYSYPGKDGSLLPSIPINKGAGNMVCYYSNGTKALECNWIDGQFEGKRIFYTPAGKVFEDENYQMGDLSGLQKYYYANGNLNSEENYYSGEKDSVCNYYYQTGKLEHSEHWALGVRHGKFQYYDEKGKLIKTKVYYNDDEVSEK